MKSVYVMRSNSTYKIGVSQNPSKRMHDLGLGNCNIELIYESKKLSNAYAVEQALHKQFCDCAVGREWFSIPNERKLIDAVCTLVDEIGICAVDPRKDLSKDRQAEKLVNWVLSPEKRKLEELCKENDKIAEENRDLSERLIKLGWTHEEVESLIDAALETVSNYRPI